MMLRQAWETARLSRVKRFPSLKSLLSESKAKPKPQKQTNDEVIAVMRALMARQNNGG